jgi:hypothetical protein
MHLTPLRYIGGQSELLPVSCYPFIYSLGTVALLFVLFVGYVSYQLGRRS